MKIKAKTGDLALGIFSILGGIIILILTKVQGLQLIKGGQMGPGFFPTICGIAIAICGAMVLLEAARRIARAKTAQAEKEELETNILNLTELKNLLLFMLLGTGVLLLSENMGPRKVDQVDRDRCMYGGVPVRGLCPVPACAGPQRSAGLLRRRYTYGLAA